MALLSNGFKGNILTGLAIGIGASIVAPVVIPVISHVAKPLAKAAIKGGLLLYDKGMETFAETKEVVEDIIAETKAEMSEEMEAASMELEEVVAPPTAGTASKGTKRKK
jgi:hypothetical protein